MGNRIEYLGNGIYQFVAVEAQQEQQEAEKRKAWLAELDKRYKEFYGVERNG